MRPFPRKPRPFTSRAGRGHIVAQFRWWIFKQGSRSTIRSSVIEPGFPNVHHVEVEMRIQVSMLCCSLLLAGCLDRKETIKVEKDGSVSISHVLKGDPGEFKASRIDALPG